MKRSFRRRWRTKLAGVVAVILFILGTDWGARLWLDVHRPSLAATRQNHSPAYSHSSYWGPDFWREQDELAHSWVLGDDGRWTSSYHGHWFNVENGIRQTVFQPTNYTHNVYVFGNSTVFGFGVPDEYTIPSQLQRLFNEYYPGTYRVTNLAVTGGSASMEWQNLKLTKLNRGDLVIFYDGVTEILPVIQHIEVRRNALLSGQVCNVLADHFWRLGVVQMYCTLVDRAVPPQASDAALQAKVGSEFETILREAYQSTSQSGAQFYHFLQPHLWTVPLLPYEEDIVANPDLVEPGLGKFFVAMWPRLQAVSDTIPESFDFTHITDNARQAGVKMFIDFDHMTEAGTAIVAKAMFDAITVF